MESCNTNRLSSQPLTATLFLPPLVPASESGPEKEVSVLALEYVDVMLDLSLMFWGFLALGFRGVGALAGWASWF